MWCTGERDMQGRDDAGQCNGRQRGPGLAVVRVGRMVGQTSEQESRERKRPLLATFFHAAVLRYACAGVHKASDPILFVLLLILTVTSSLRSATSDACHCIACMGGHMCAWPLA